MGNTRKTQGLVESNLFCCLAGFNYFLRAESVATIARGGMFYVWVRGGQWCYDGPGHQVWAGQY